MSHAEIITLSSTEPKYHMTKAAAACRQNTEGTRIWRRIGPKSIKPFATGDIPEWMIGDWYEELPNPH